MQRFFWNIMAGAFVMMSGAGCTTDSAICFRQPPGAPHSAPGVVAPHGTPAPVPLRPDEDTGCYWGGDGMTGRTTVRISLGEQRAYLYRGGQIAGVSRISSGREGMDTPTGTFCILEKEASHRSSFYGNYVDGSGAAVQKDVDVRENTKPRGSRFEGAEMPYFMRITGSTGMHAGFLPGHAASHGCIRLPTEMARAFYGAISVGTPVTIER